MKATNFIDISELDDIFGEMDINETCETIKSLQDDFTLKSIELKACIEKNDVATFKLKSHSLKSNCCYLGANQLSQMSYKLELTDSFDNDKFSENWMLFNEVFTLTMNEIISTVKRLEITDN